MKKSTLLFLTLIIIPIFAIAQSITDVDFISPFHDGVAAIQKDGNWAFINKEGKQIIDFSFDLVFTNTENGDYTMFNYARCPIVEIKAGNSYFGFINKSGETAIAPKLLNSNDFKDGTVIAFEVKKHFTLLKIML